MSDIIPHKGGKFRHSHLTKNITLFTNGLELDSGVKEILPRGIVIVKDKIEAVEETASSAGNTGDV